MKDSSVLTRLLFGAIVATSLLSVGCGAPKDETVSPEAIPSIPPSDRGSAEPGPGGKGPASGGKLAPPGK